MMSTLSVCLRRSWESIRSHGAGKGSLAVFLASTALLLTLGAGCKPDYPTCETDKDCHTKEFCVANKCQQCRQDADCGSGQSCQAGKCGAIPGYCLSKAQCPADQECIANRCRPCTADTECPSGSKCWKGSCSAQKHCAKDDDCAQDEDCVNQVCTKGAKPTATPMSCALDTVYFDFNESALTTTATSTLAKNVECLKSSGNKGATLVGHSDPRGTAEYNIALSEKRAASVKTYLQHSGIDGSRLNVLPRGSLDAKGSDEPSWAQDRRVDGQWR